MSAEFDHVTLLAVRIAAARLDPAVDSATFVDLLQRFAAAVVRDVERVNAPPAADDDDDSPVLPAASDLAAPLSQESVAAATGGAASNATTATPGKAGGGAPDVAQSAAATEAAAGTPPAPSSRTIPLPASTLLSSDAGPSPDPDSSGPGAAEPQGADRRRVLTDEHRERLCAEYKLACAANDGHLPYGWLSKKATELDVGVSAIHRAIRPAAVPPRSSAPPAQPQPPATAESTEPDEFVHTETPACWCRRKPANRENVWCKLRQSYRPASEHAALRPPPPRNERFKTRRVEGTRY